MPVSFLDLVPKPPTATITLETTTGPQEVGLEGLRHNALADICRRFPEFQKLFDGGSGSVREHPDAIAAFIAASLGYPGDERCEALVGTFPAADVIRITNAVIALTFPQRDADPLSADVAVNGAEVAPGPPSLPSPSSG